MLFAPTPMHIPDGFLSTLVAVILWVLAVPVIAVSLRRVNRDLGEREVPVMGVLAAAIFAGQMLNFTVTGGTSGHLIGGALATIVLGPWAAVLVMTCVVAVQALIFQDGGLLALGGNLLNMAVIAPFVAYAVYRLIQRVANGRSWALFVGGFAAAWTSVFVASLATALQLAASGTSPANVAVPAMAGIHALIGIGEGLITTGALALIFAARRDLLQRDAAPSTRSNSPVWVGGGLLALALVILSPLASAHPDGLEWVAEQKGFIDTAQGSLYNVIPDYVFPGVSNEAAATILAGIVGALIVLGAAVALTASRRKQAKA